MNIIEMIKQQLLFYGEVFDSILLNVNERQNVQNMIKCILFHL